MNVIELKEGYTAFKAANQETTMYKTATFLVKTFWGAKRNGRWFRRAFAYMESGIFRYGSFDFAILEKCISDNQHILENYRNRNIRIILKR